jgi:hypothetical protein
LTPLLAARDPHPLKSRVATPRPCRQPAPPPARLLRGCRQNDTGFAGRIDARKLAPVRYADHHTARLRPSGGAFGTPGTRGPGESGRYRGKVLKGKNARTSNPGSF